MESPIAESDVEYCDNSPVECAVESPVESPIETFVVRPPACKEPPTESPVLDPVLDPAPSDVLSASSVDKPPDEISIGSAFDSAPVLCSGSPGSSVFGPATVQLASVKKPPDGISIDSAPSLPDPQWDLHFRPPDILDAAPAREPPPPLESRSASEDSAKRAEKQLHEPGIRQVGEEHAMLAPTSLQQPEPSSVPRCASQRSPVLLSATQHLSAPTSACRPTCLFGPPFRQYHRPCLRRSRCRLRRAHRLLTRKPPGRNSRRLPRLR
jgi:hypothetical protein